MQKDHRHKLEKKALEMTFVGYAEGTKGYLFWNPAKRSIVVSRDVIFDENVFPARKDSGNLPVTPGDKPFNDPVEDDTPPDDLGFDINDIPIPFPSDN